ncbi:TldD/PmbA family protein [Paenibacillus albiflavus]|uniref:TldD/PmbA family protein n=1 Tax=Paenibacillus albiflavus TaxID=2545760 RepID=A0A4R4EIB3_9BACL|nr:TldD/PmbA family protein [Paenibacillus albiflavus]TCZ79876.1 TldD/PmbA family protein [Paenibacillus albiflavus]
MDIRSFQEKLFARGQELGVHKLEIYYQQGRSTSVRVVKGEIDAYTIKESGGLSLRLEHNGQMGYAYTEKLDEDSIDFLIEEARQNAGIVESKELEELFAGSESYVSLSTYSEALSNVAPEKLIEAALAMEKEALQADPRITMVHTSSVSNSESEVFIANNLGLDCAAKYNQAVAGIYVIAEEGGEKTTGGWYEYTLEDFDQVDYLKAAREAVKEAVSKLGADTIESSNYPVIFRQDAASTMLEIFTNIFSAEAVDKDFSRLKGKIGEQVAASIVTIVDDPHMANVPARCTFDAEGSATKRVEIIKEGQLLTFLHNRKTAQKFGVESTGHATKGSYRAKIGISPQNLFITAGATSLEDMIGSMDKGLMITDLQGTHAGANAVSGEFSLSCNGFLIENGAIVRPVNQITVSGNFFNLLQDVEVVGNDLRFLDSCTSPSLKVKSLTISGA